MWAWLAACAEEPGRGVQDAAPVACLAVPDGATLPPDGIVTGTASADSSDLDADWTYGDRCADRSRVFELHNDDGFWRLGYGWSEAGFDATRPMPVGPDDALTLRFVSVGLASGFVLRASGSILLASLEVGTDSPALPEDAVENLVVRNGSVTGSAPTDCGRLVARQLVFSAGGPSLTLEPVDQDRMTIEGRDLEVWALTNTAIANPDCDVDGRRAWALWATE
jgi:hypothetical protein